jgi:hypothetical protein
MVVVATPAVIRDFVRRVRNQPGIEPDVIETLVEFKDSYFADPDPAHWTVDVVEELLLEILPRKVTAPDEWFAAVTPTTRAYLQFLADRDRMSPGSDQASTLLAAVDQIGDRALAASRDPRNFGTAKAILTRVGFDPSLPDPAGAALEAFNALPYAERAAAIDPALRGPGFRAALNPPDRDQQPGPDEPFDLDELLGPDEPFDLDELLALAEPDDADGPSLPMIWLPPAPELAAAVRSAPLVTGLLRLTAWNGAGRKVTRRNLLPLAEARHACADLGLPLPSGKLRSAEHLPALHRLWILALDRELLQIAGGQARRGEAAELLADPAADPGEVVEWWVSLLDACLVEGLGLADEDEGDDEDDDIDGTEDVAGADDEDEAPEDDVVEAVEDVLPLVLREMYSSGRVPLAAMDKAVQEMVHEILHGLFTATDLTDDRVNALALRGWRAHVDQLVDLGAATIEDGGLDLTPLGRAGMRAIALDDGGHAPLIDDPASLDATTLLQALTPLGESVRTPLLAEWSATRPPTQAIDQVLDAARAGTAITRMTASTVLRDLYADHLSGAGRALLLALRDDPVLAAYAHVLLTEPGQPVHLPPHLKQWTALEAVALALEGGAFDSEGDPAHDPDSLAFLWQIVDQDADLGTAATSPHPQLGDILNAIATHHPQGRTRKAAKKALFKARNQHPSDQPEQGRRPPHGWAPRGGRRRS